jgi:hypothetical protein
MMMVKTARKLSPQERAIGEKRAFWREKLSSGLLSSSDFNPVTFDWKTYGEHFAPLSDEEWAVVWAHATAASKREPSEARVRELVNDAAISSGWFAEYRALRLSGADHRRRVEDRLRALKKVVTFRRYLNDFFGRPDWDDKDLYDPWRLILLQLDDLANLLRHQIYICEDDAEFAKQRDPPRTAKPELDCWRARLLLVWENEVGLPVHNSKHVRGFLLEAMRPYMPRAELTDRMAKYFIGRWLAGKVERPRESLLQRLTASRVASERGQSFLQRIDAERLPADRTPRHDRRE